MPLRFRRFPFLSAAILALLSARLSWVGSGVWGVMALLLAALWFGIELVRWLLPPKESGKAVATSVRTTPAQTASAQTAPAQPTNQSLVSLVFFLSESRQVDENSITKCVVAALHLTPEVPTSNLRCVVEPFDPPDPKPSEAHIRHFMVWLREGFLAVLVSDRPYIENPKDFARDSIRDKRLRSAVERHLAWISVDFVSYDSDFKFLDQDPIQWTYQAIGKILASMAGPDCLAVYCPELQRCNEFDPGLLEILSGPNPLSLFEEPTFEPVIEISDNNPRMATAVREAVSRWPEFVAAFEGSELADRDRYIAKAEFREGKKAEYMWVAVEEIEADTVTGTLMNDPHELLDVHRGARVCFTLDRLNDWIYPDRGGRHVGGFTLDVLADDGEM